MSVLTDKEKDLISSIVNDSQKVSDETKNTITMIGDLILLIDRAKNERETAKC